MGLEAAGDSKLVERCLDGSDEAWELLVDRYARLVYSVPRRMGLGQEDVEEVFQETFTTLFRKLATIENRTRIASWLGVTARRKALEKTIEVSLPHARYAIATYYAIANAEASSNLARFDGVRYGHRAAGAKGLTEMYRRTRSEGFGAEVKRRILLGTYFLSAGYYDAYYRKAQQVRTLLRGDFERAFEVCDAMITPTSPEIAFRLGEKTSDPLTMYLSDIYTVSANLAGIPALSTPCGFIDELPVGLQVLGPALDEAISLRVADGFQRITDYHAARPGDFA